MTASVGEGRTCASLESPVKIAVAGTGYIAHYHARAIAVAGGRVAAVLSRTAKKGERFVAEHGGTVFTDLAQLLDSRPDALVVALPNDQHLPVARAALMAGADVLLEKPMARNAREANILATVAAENDRVLMIGHMWRYDPQAVWLREQVADGRLGKIVKTKGYGIHVDWGPSGWFAEPAQAGGGALIDMGVHAIDTARFLLGDPLPRRVYAQLDAVYADGPLDDHGVIVITWDNGVTSIVESGWWNTHADGAEASTQLFGTQGYGRLFPTSVTVGPRAQRVEEAPAFPAREEHCDQSIYNAQMDAFVADSRARRVPLSCAAVGQVIMQICDAAYESSRTGRAIEL